MRIALGTLVLTAVLIVLVGGCSDQSAPFSPAAATLPPRLESYFEDYCDYTGGIGIGFDPSHTYDFRFRQHLKTTHDPELKRLFVLQHLHRHVELALRDFGAGIVMTGKSSSRPLTLSEWHGTQQSIQTQIDDLAVYVAFTNFAAASRNPLYPDEPDADGGWIKGLYRKFASITNAPAVE